MAACVGSVPLRECELLRRKSVYDKEGRTKRTIENPNLRRRDYAIAGRRGFGIPVFQFFGRWSEESLAVSSIYIEIEPIELL